MITAEELQLALDGSITTEALGSALAEQPPLRWGPATPETLEVYARKPVLQRGEAVALLQGFTPPVPDFQDAKIFYLDDFADVITRFLRDADACIIPVPCRPRELVEWADALRVSLPPAFRTGVRSDPSKARQNDSEAPARAPRPLAVAKQFGETGHDEVLQAHADEIARALLTKWKRHPTKKEVARHIEDKIEHRLTIERIMRLIRNTWDPTGRGKRRKPNAPHAARLKGR